ncbi:MAG: ATP-binding protein [Bacteroidetes bacterium]|nr:ATP-binding protein [Bacteroidota bacterium]MCH8523752.1 ATP-binding protein [Balneolales bacterium]
MTKQNLYEFTSSYDNLSRLEGIVDEATRESGLSEDQKEALMLVASEAMTNAIKHGNKLDEEKKVTISWQITDGELRFSIQDEGEGFDADALPDPLNPENLLKDSGRGVFLMKTYCDDVQFELEGRKVILVFKIS